MERRTLSSDLNPVEIIFKIAKGTIRQDALSQKIDCEENIFRAV